MQVMGGTNPEELVRMGNNGAVDAILNAMRQFPNDPNIQVHGTNCLARLTHTDPRLVSELMKYNATIDIFHAAEQFPDVLALQRDACWVAANLSQNDEARRTLVEVGFLAHIVKMMQMYPDDLDLNRYATTALCYC